MWEMTKVAPCREDSNKMENGDKNEQKGFLTVGEGGCLRTPQNSGRLVAKPQARFLPGWHSGVGTFSTLDSTIM